MKRFALIGLVLLVAVLAGGCAGAKPKIYVPESELPKTKFVVVEVSTYKEFKLDEEKKEFIFSNPVNREYGRIFKEAFVKELEIKGFVVIPTIMDTKKDNNDFLVIEVSFADKQPLIPFTNGLLVQTTVVKNKERDILRLDSALFTDPPIVPPAWVARVKFAPALAEKIAEIFKK